MRTKLVTRKQHLGRELRAQGSLARRRRSRCWNASPPDGLGLVHGTQAPHIARAQLDASFASANATHLRAGGHRKKIDRRRQGCGGVCSTCEAASASTSAAAFGNMFREHRRAHSRRCKQRQLLTVRARAAVRAAEGELGSGSLAAVLG